MTYVISHIWDPANDESPWASFQTGAAEIAPEIGTMVALRSPSVGGPNAQLLRVTHVSTLFSFDGFLVGYLLPDLDYAEEREFRDELQALGWTIHAPERRLDPLADEDDFDDD